MLLAFRPPPLLRPCPPAALLLRAPIGPPRPLLAARGFGANHVTINTVILCLAWATCVAFQLFYIAFWLIVLDRVADGMDGAFVLAIRNTDFGGYLDIVCDIVYFSAIPVAFAVAQPENALVPAFLVFRFIGTTSSFLAFAIFAENRNISSETLDKKGFYYLRGLTEGTGTILLLLAMIILLSYFIFMVLRFGFLCRVSTKPTMYAAYRQFND